MLQINSANFFKISENKTNKHFNNSVTLCVIIIYYLLIFFSLNL